MWARRIGTLLFSAVAAALLFFELQGASSPSPFFPGAEEPTDSLTSAAAASKANPSPSDVARFRPASRPGDQDRESPGRPGSSVTVETASSLRVQFPLPYPPRPPLDIFDSAVLSETACGGLVAGDPSLLLHLAVLLGRVRLSVSCNGAAGNLLPTRAAMEDFLFKRAPMWYLALWAGMGDEEELVGEGKGHSGGARRWVLRRRQKVLVFAITGGTDGRAVYVERTWGQRTPIVWFGDVPSPELRPIVDLHPMYTKDRFRFLTFKISRIWQRVFEDYGAGPYDWFIRLWDDNYFYEEGLHTTLGRLDAAKPQMAGKIGWRYLSDSAIFPFAGGGAGWFLSRAGLQVVGPTIAQAEQWFVEFRRRRDIFLPHDIHDEDVFLTAWFHLRNLSFVNIPGLEHVSPGMGWRQRCLDDPALLALRWDPAAAIYFNYPAQEPQFRIENATYAFTKPIVWHYMSPSRLIALETLLYPERKAEFRGPVPLTASDQVKRRRRCYPGTPMPLPMRGVSIFEEQLPDPPTDRPA